MNPRAVAVKDQRPLTDMQPLATITILTPAELSITIVVIITYLVQGGQDKEKRWLQSSKAKTKEKVLIKSTKHLVSKELFRTLFAITFSGSVYPSIH